MAYTRLHILPICVFVWFTITFIATYLVASLSGHVPFFVPYISDTGTFVPESCIFGQLINLGLVQMILVMYVRYRQIGTVATGRCVLALNRASMLAGYVSVLGVDVVANFQVRSVFALHVLGAVAAFGFGTLYLVLQTLISFSVLSVGGGGRMRAWLWWTRLTISVVSVVCFFACVSLGAVSMALFRGTDMQQWGPEDGGYGWHVASALCEWIVALVMQLYVLTFVPEFRRLSLAQPQLHVLLLEDEEEGGRAGVQETSTPPLLSEEPSL